jgi:uncharacterized membrane protein SpoIIM required for sporulation
MMISGFSIGRSEIRHFIIPLQDIGTNDINQGLGNLFTVWPVFSFGPVFAIWGQNVRVLVIGLGLGIFSFGILGMLPALATIGIAGYLMELLATQGIDRAAYLAGFILPHGVLEIPAVIFATAAVLKMGAVLATPDRGRTVGETWLVSLADWVKVMLGLVIPLLFVAAMVEAWVTPQVAAFFLH